MLNNQETVDRLSFLVGPEFFCDDFLAPRYDLCVGLGSFRLIEQVEFVYCALRSDDAERVFHAVNNWGVNLVAHQFFDLSKPKVAYKQFSRVLRQPTCLGVHSKELCDAMHIPFEKRYEMLSPDEALDVLEMSCSEPTAFAFEENLKKARARVQNNT